MDFVTQQLFFDDSNVAIPMATVALHTSDCNIHEKTHTP